MQAAVDELQKELTDLKSRLDRQQTIVIQEKRKLRKYEGAESGSFQEWKEDAQSAIHAHNLSDSAAASFVINALGSAAKRELKCRKDSCRASAAAIFAALGEVLGDSRTVSQHYRSFHARKQAAGESVMEFSHALVQLMSCIEAVKPLTATEHERMLKDQFSENVTNAMLRWELRKHTESDPNSTFNKFTKTGIRVVG